MNDTVVSAEVQPTKKVSFVSKPYSREDKIQKDEEELKQMLEEQKASQNLLNLKRKNLKVQKSVHLKNAMVIYADMHKKKKNIFRVRLIN